MCATMQPYLRDAVASDLADVCRLLLGSDTDDPRVLGTIRDALHEIDHTDGNYVLVAELGGRVVGMLQLVVVRHLQHRGGRCAEIETVRVLRDECPPGVITQLVERAVERARELGCYRVQVTITADRGEHATAFEGLGFEPSHVGYKLALDGASTRSIAASPTRSAKLSA
jgi:GNAT superfamily N-acetyltransferase